MRFTVGVTHSRPWPPMCHNKRVTENTKTPMLRSLEKSTLEIERHVATGGWDAPMRLFALAHAQRALAEHPELADELPADVQADAITEGRGRSQSPRVLRHRFRLPCEGGFLNPQRRRAY